MRKAKYWMVLSLMVSFLLSSYSSVLSSDYKEPKFSLKGLEEICWVYVGYPCAGKCMEPPKSGEPESKYEIIIMEDEEMSGYAEMRCKKAGIRITHRYKGERISWMEIQVNTKNTPPDHFLSHVELRLNQSICLERTKDVGLFYGTTYWIWHGDLIPNPPPKDEAQYIREGVEAVMDKFIKDYLSVNQK